PESRAHQESISPTDEPSPFPLLKLEKGGAGRESFRRGAPGTNHAHRSVPLLHDPTPPHRGPPPEGQKIIRLPPGWPAPRNAQNIKTTAGLGTDAAGEEPMGGESKRPAIGAGAIERAVA